MKLKITKKLTQKLTVAAMLLAVMPTTVLAGGTQNAAPDRSTVVSQLTSIASAAPGTDKTKAALTIVGIRGGGNTGKPLGQYLVKPNMEFRSEYKRESADTMSRFAFDLHEFVKLKGGDWPKMQLDSKLDYVSYEKQKEFASFWWLRNKANFKGMPGIAKDWFLNDALIDATNLYNWYARKDYGSADYISWEDVAISSLMKKKP